MPCKLWQPPTEHHSVAALGAMALLRPYLDITFHLGSNWGHPRSSEDGELAVWEELKGLVRAHPEKAMASGRSNCSLFVRERRLSWFLCYCLLGGWEAIRLSWNKNLDWVLRLFHSKDNQVVEEVDHRDCIVSTSDAFQK